MDLELSPRGMHPAQSTDTQPQTPRETAKVAQTFGDTLAQYIEQNAQRGNRVDEPQRRIYNAYLKSIEAVAQNVLSDFPVEARGKFDTVYNELAEALVNSFARINNLKKTLPPEIASATSNLLTSSSKAKRNVTGAELTDQVAQRLYDGVCETFRNEANDAQIKFLAGLELVLGTTDKSFPIEKVTDERISLTDSFKLAEKEIKRLAQQSEQELAALERPIHEVVEAAFNQQISDKARQPFYIAPNRPINTDLPDVTDQDPPLPKDSAAGKALQTALNSAGRYGILESFITTGSTFTVPISSGLTLGLVTAAAQNAKLGVVAGVLTGTIQTMQPLIRDCYLARSRLNRHLTGVDRNVELQRLSSPYQQARLALVDRYGTDWLTDFENWALRPLTLSLNNAITIANKVRGEMNHHLLLHSEFQRAEIDREDENLPAHIREDARHTSSRFNIERNALDEQLAIHGIRCMAEDHIGIRCLSHMRDKALTDDAKKLSEYLKAHPRFTQADRIVEETTAWIRTNSPYTGQQYTWPTMPVRSIWYAALRERMKLIEAQPPRPLLPIHQRRGYSRLEGQPATSAESIGTV